ncbi:hypothetical protein DL98DRAFT_581703 [Cadophora sp. DSE1049]|nr:hypothetical protein DL98DRAFT_581703 [Cadophora sp. DSE1049]
MTMIYEREIRLQESKAQEAAKEAAKLRHSAIKSEWEDHVLRLLNRGLLDQQPNVRTVEDGFVYDLRILHQPKGNLKIITRCENEDMSDGREKEVYSAELVVELVSDRDSDREIIITPVTTSPVTHDRTKCMVCFGYPGWCSSVSGGETVTPITVRPVYQEKLKDVSMELTKPVWRDWGLLYGLY